MTFDCWPILNEIYEEMIREEIAPFSFTDSVAEYINNYIDMYFRLDIQRDNFINSYGIRHAIELVRQMNVEVDGTEVLIYAIIQAHINAEDYKLLYEEINEINTFETLYLKCIDNI